MECIEANLSDARRVVQNLWAVNPWEVNLGAADLWVVNLSMDNHEAAEDREGKKVDLWKEAVCRLFHWKKVASFLVTEGVP